MALPAAGNVASSGSAWIVIGEYAETPVLKPASGPPARLGPRMTALPISPSHLTGVSLAGSITQPIRYPRVQGAAGTGGVLMLIWEPSAGKASLPLTDRVTSKSSSGQMLLLTPS